MAATAETLHLAAALLRAGAGRAALLAGLLGGLGAGWVPLLEVPGWELGTLSGVAAALLGAGLGIGAARRQPFPARAGAAAGLAVAAALLLLFGSAWARTALLTPCRAGAAADLFWLAALPSGLCGAALGALAATLARGRRLRAAALATAGFALSIGATLWRAWSGPAAAASDHLLGSWPGPIYDEALAVDGRLLLFRTGTLCWTAALLGAAALVARRRRGAPLHGAILALALGGAGALLARAAGGVEPSRGQVAQALGGARAGPRCQLHFPGEWAPHEAERLLRDCEASAAEVARALSLAHPPRARVFVYRSAEEKRRLVGAGRTSFTKPWLQEIHVNPEPSPRPVLRHELVHALASAFAEGPLRVPARGLVLVNGGLVEGLAAALEPPRGDFTLHEWARAMRDLGLLPSPAELLGGGRFFGAAPARAYAAAGSWTAFLLERHGPSLVREIYRTGEAGPAPGRDLAALSAEWSGFLDGIVVTPELSAAAELRFREGSLLSRTCGREQAALEERGREAAHAGRAEAAERAFRRAALLAGGDPAPLREAGDAWRTADPARAGALYGEALARARQLGGQRALRAGILAAEADLAMAAGRTAAAAEGYRAARQLAPDPAEARSLTARLMAAEDPALGDAIAPILLGGGDPALALARLAGSERPLARYLLARATLARGAPRRALGLFRSLDPDALPDARFAVEARRLRAEAACATGAWEEALGAFEALATGAARAAERARAGDAARRCAFERDEYGHPLAWPGDRGEPW